MTSPAIVTEGAGYLLVVQDSIQIVPGRFPALLERKWTKLGVAFLSVQKHGVTCSNACQSELIFGKRTDFAVSVYSLHLNAPRWIIRTPGDAGSCHLIQHYAWLDLFPG